MKPCGAHGTVVTTTRARRLRLMIVCGLMVVALAACGSTSNAAKQSKSTNNAGRSSTPIAVNVEVYPGTIWSAPIYAAQDEGFFAEEGITANLVPANTGPAAIAALASGSVDTISVSPEVILGAIAGGLKAQVWTGTMKNPWDILLSNKITPVSKTYPADLKTLKGLTVGVPSIPSAGQALVEASLISVGLSPSEAKYVSVGIGPPALAALESGEIQALVTQQPIAEATVAKVHALMLANPTKGQLPPGLSGPYLGQWSSTAYIQSHEAAIVRMHKALNKAAAWLSSAQNTKAVATFLQKIYQTTGISYTKMAIADRSLWTDSYTATALRTWDNYDVKYGFLKHAISTTGLLWTGP